MAKNASFVALSKLDLSCVVCKLHSDFSGQDVFTPINYTRTTSSNVVLAFKLFEMLSIEAIDGVICADCLGLVNEIDAFEQSAATSKAVFKERLQHPSPAGGAPFVAKKSVPVPDLEIDCFPDLDFEEGLEPECTVKKEEEEEEDDFDEAFDYDESPTVHVSSTSARGRKRKAPASGYNENSDDDGFDNDDDFMDGDILADEIKHETDLENDADVEEGMEKLYEKIHLTGKDGMLEMKPTKIANLKYDLFKMSAPRGTMPSLHASSGVDDSICGFCHSK